MLVAITVFTAVWWKPWTWPLPWDVYGHSDLLVFCSQCLVLCWAQTWHSEKAELNWDPVVWHCWTLSNLFPVTQINFLPHLHCRLCYDAFTENMAGENQLLERRRLYHCAAYNCAISVVCCIFNDLKFYQGFLFCEKPEKVSHSSGIHHCCHYRVSKVRLHQLKLYCNLYLILL